MPLLRHAAAAAALALLSVLPPSNARDDPTLRFYYEADCIGNYAVRYGALRYEQCYSLDDNQGFARSLWSNMGHASGEHVVAFRPSGREPCGTAVCSFTQWTGRGCCTSQQKNIKGAAIFAPPCKRDCGGKGNRTDLKKLPPGEGGNATEAAGVAAVRSEIFVSLADGGFYGLGVGRNNITVETLQEELAALGLPQLSEERIAVTRDHGIII